MKRLALLVVLAGCPKEPSEGFPINPGGSGSGLGSSFTPDAPPESDGDGGTMINGRVCLLLASPHTLATCAASGAGNFTVKLGSNTTATADDGSFTMMRPAVTTNLVWLVSGTGIEKSAVKYGGSTTLPAIDTLAYQDMVASTNATIGAGTGAIMMRVTRQGFAVAGATVTTAPVSDSGIYYDGPDPTSWQQTETGTFGVAWAPSIDTGNANLTITDGSTNTTVMAQPVLADTITFVFAAIP